MAGRVGEFVGVAEALFGFDGGTFAAFEYFCYCIGDDLDLCFAVAEDIT